MGPSDCRMSSMDDSISSTPALYSPRIHSAHEQTREERTCTGGGTGRRAGVRWGRVVGVVGGVRLMIPLTLDEEH